MSTASPLNAEKRPGHPAKSHRTAISSDPYYRKESAMSQPTATAVDRSIPESLSAQAYMAAGLAVFPCKPRGKAPRGGRGFKDATTDYRPEDWPDDANIGLPMGPNGLVAIDVDDMEAAEDLVELIRQHPTAVQRTSKGVHAVYSTDEKLSNSVDKLRGFDVRGDGYILVEPSIHPDGSAYRWEEHRDIAPLPEDLRRLMKASRPSDSTMPPATSAEVEAFLDEHSVEVDGGILHLMDRIEDARHRLGKGGGRNDTEIAVLPQIYRDARRGLYSAREGREHLRRLLVDEWGGGDHPFTDAEFDEVEPQAVGYAKDDDLTGGYGSVLDETDTLRRIRDFAHSRGRSGASIMVHVLARVLAEVPPKVTLPPKAGGSAASLNLGVAVVGGSGSGKSTAMAVSAEVLGEIGHSQRKITRGVGSGEGMAEQFIARASKAKPEPIERPHRLFTVDEIESLGAGQARSGATIGPTIRTALTGGTLGQANAKAENNRHVPEGSYRLCLIAGVQPTRSAVLLDDTDAGTPQRFVWVNAEDSATPRFRDRPATPDPLDWSVEDLGLEDVEHIDYPDHIAEEIADLHDSLREKRIAGTATDADGLAAHEPLTRLKVAAALALLHGGVEITDQWWTLAGRITAASMAVQDQCRAVLAESAVEEAERSARMTAVRDRAVDRDREERITKAAARFATWVHRHAARGEHDPEEGCPARCRQQATKHYRTGKDPLTKAEVEAAGPVAVENEWLTEDGGRYLPGQVAPDE